MFFEIIILILLGVIAGQQYLYYKLVKDLTLKIKAKDLSEYDRVTKKIKPKKPEPEIIQPEEADAMAYLKALRK